MGEVKAAANKPAQFFTKAINNLIAGFIKWVSTMFFTILITSVLFASVANGCHFDNGTMSKTRQNMSQGFNWWALGMEKFTDILKRVSEALY